MLFLITVFTFLSGANELEMIIDGETYRCEKVQSSGTTAADCVDMAYKGPFNRDQAIQLCQGQSSVAPAECGIQAYRGPFNTDQAIELCKKARSTGPSQCGIDAYSGPFNTSQAIELCKNGGNLERSECAKKAYQGPYSSDEAVQLCKSNSASLVIRSLMLLESSPEMRQRVQLIKSQIKKPVRKDIAI